jgi:hypothetical protein
MFLHQNNKTQGWRPGDDAVPATGMWLHTMRAGKGQDPKLCGDFQAPVP